MAAFAVVRPGMLTTVQDLGRWGLQHLGVPVAGPMDWYSHRLANRLVGNAENAAALEMTLLGPELIADADLSCAVAGAALDVIVGEESVNPDDVFTVHAGKRVRFMLRRPGARATLAVRGGIDVAPVLGSRATSLSAAWARSAGEPWRPVTYFRSARCLSQVGARACDSL